MLRYLFRIFDHVPHHINPYPQCKSHKDGVDDCGGGNAFAQAFNLLVADAPADARAELAANDDLAHEFNSHEDACPSSDDDSDNHIDSSSDADDTSRPAKKRKRALPSLKAKCEQIAKNRRPPAPANIEHMALEYPLPPHLQILEDNRVVDMGSALPQYLGKLYICRNRGGTSVSVRCACWLPEPGKPRTYHENCGMWLSCDRGSASSIERARRCLAHWLMQGKTESWHKIRHDSETHQYRAVFRGIA